MRTVFTLLSLLTLSRLMGPAPDAGEQEEGYVSVAAKLSQDGVHGGMTMRAALLVTVRGGWHINSSSPADENLVATSASFSPPPGLSVGDVRYPRPTAKKFSFSDGPLDVYEGTVVILLEISPAAGMKPGTYSIPVDISYQACNNDVCLAPADVHAVLPVRVLAPEVSPAPLNPGLFNGTSDK